jgi:2-amino-4-hydroxy-6-hydroxymethyldihydropteridine diphosphokinase
MEIGSRHCLLALGANIDGTWGRPAETIERAVTALSLFVKINSRSALYCTSPVGPIDQPAFVNAVAAGTTELDPVSLLRALKELERQAGRIVGERWGPRPLDLDILDYAGMHTECSGSSSGPPELLLPHPELHRRPFVLVPLREIAPDWLHPVLGLRPAEMLALLPVEPITVI